MDVKLYEFPLTERTRNLMRLENCFAQINYFLNRGSLADSQACLVILTEMLNIIDRNDIRTEVTKELERNIAFLSGLLEVPGINALRLQQILDSLHTQLYAMQNISGK